MSKAPTVIDVADHAGVSRQTVSNVLNAPEVVRPETRARVMSSIELLGYRRHAAARRLRTRRSSTIAVRLDPYAGGISGVVLDRFVHALADQADSRALRLLVYTAREPEEEIARLSELVDGGEIDAAVIVGTYRGDPRTHWLDSGRLPFVLFGRPWGEGSEVESSRAWVDVDGAAGTRQATEHALATRGQRVAFLGWPKGSGTGDDRERGWREVVRRGVRITSEEDVEQARTAASKVVSDVDAVVCASDLLAVGAQLAARDAGCRGVAIYGFDNTPTAEALGFSSVEQLPERVARGALDLLLGPSGHIEHTTDSDAGSRSVLVTPTLVVR